MKRLLSALLGILLCATAAQAQTQAITVRTFTNTMVVQNKFENSNGPTISVPAVTTAMAFLNPQGVGTGIGVIREGANAPSSPLNSMGSLGYKLQLFGAYASPGSNSGASITSAVQPFINSGYVGVLEGPLEVDNTGFGLAVHPTTTNYTALNSTTYTGWQAAVEYQNDFWNTFHTNTQIALFTLANPGNGASNSPAVTAASQLGLNLKNITNLGNVHFYQHNGNSPINQMPGVISQETGYTSGLPFTISETGFNDDTSGSAASQSYYGNPTVNAKYTLNTFFDAYKQGSRRTVYYELFDEGTAGSEVNPVFEGHWGLFNFQQVAKPAATYLHNLLTVISDAGATASSFTPATATYSIAGLGSNGNSLLMQHSNGTFFLVVWADANIFTNGVQSTAPTQNITVSFGTPQNVTVFDPGAGTTPIQTASAANSVSVGITDHPEVLAFSPANTGKVPVPAPLSGTVTLNAWQTFDQSFAGITLACGKPFHFNVAQPPQYNPSAYTYPLYIWLHPDFDADDWYDGRNTNPFKLTGNEGGSYNTVSWMTQFPAFYALPYADQTNGNGGSGSCTGDGNDAIENWGGWFNNGTTGSGTHYSGDTGPNTFALLKMITFLESQYSIDASRIYVNGFSLGAIGSGYLCQHYNIINGSPAVFAACLESGGGVDQADTPVTSTTIAKMQQVPKWAFSGANDTMSPPGSYNTPLCSGLGGNPSGQTAITSATADRCGTSQMRYTLCPTCGHQETDAQGNAVWTNVIMNQFAFAQGGGGGGPNPATAQRAGDFLNIFSVSIGLSGGGAPYIANNSAQMVNDIQYLGAQHVRDAPGDLTAGSAFMKGVSALAGAGISWDLELPYPQAINGTLTGPTFATMATTMQAGGASIFSFEQLNEPNIIQPHMAYNGVSGAGTDGLTWAPVAALTNNVYTTLKANSSLSSIPIFGVSRIGNQVNDVGLEWGLAVPTPAPSGVTTAAGTKFADAITLHPYPSLQNFVSDSGFIWQQACQPNDPVAGNAFNIETHANFVQTFQNFYNGPTSAIANALPFAITEFGYQTSGTGNNNNVNEDKKGRCLMNGLTLAFQMGAKLANIYNLYDLATTGYGLMAGSGSPNISGTYLHNLTAALADTGATSRTFTPGTLTYALTNMPTTARSLLLQTSNGHFKLLLMNDATNYNFSTNAPIAVTPVNVAVNFSGGTNFVMNDFDPTVGTAAVKTVTTGNAITVAVSDYPTVIDVVPANAARETITVSAIATQAATVPFTVSGTIANANSVPSLQYSVNGGAFQSLPVSSGTRDPYLQPGSNASVWNTPFGDGATWSAANDPITLAICNGNCVGIVDPSNNFGNTVWVSSSASDPTFTFTSSSNGRTLAPDNANPISKTMHAPVGTFAAGPYPGNGGITLADKTSFPNKFFTWGGLSPIGPLEPPGLQAGQGPFNGSQGEWDDITSDTYGQDYDTGLSGYSLRPGTIVACDVDPACNPFFPKMKHGLRFKLPPSYFKNNSAQAPPGNVLSPNGWPDRLEDFQSGVTAYTGNLPFGMALGIPLTTAMPTNLDNNCQGFFWTMQHYPLIPRDVALGGLHISVDQVADQSAWAASARGCVNQLVGLLRVLTNQHQGGQSFTTQPANGPGNRVDTGPLALSGGTANVTQTSFFFTVPGLAANASNTIAVRDAADTTVVGTSNQFIVSGPTGPLTGTPMSPLPSGYLHVVGNQMVDGGGNNVRLACVGYNEPSNFSTDIPKMRSEGFNCLRYPLYDATVCPGGTCGFGTLDQIVNIATSANMKVIFDHHGNEPSCGGQQQNGLWYDVNSSTPVAGVTWNILSQNADGCGNTPTVTYATFKSDWMQIAQHYAGNSTVIGFDLDNEPFIGGQYQTIPVNWGGNNGADLHLMCQDTGSAIEAADPGVLVICEGPINFSGPFLSGAPFPAGGHDIQELTKAGSVPVVLTGDTGSHVVYSIHDYPNDISANVPDSGSAGAQARSTAWGFLHAQNIAPVWVGEIGASLDGTTGNLADEQAWAAMIQPYINGQSGALGGPTFTGCQQPMSTDWWAFGNLPGQPLDGTLNADGTDRAAQKAVWGTFLYTTCSTNGGPGPGGVGATTWNPADKSAGITLDSTNLVATDTVTEHSDSVRSTSSATAGKLYYEITATTSAIDWSAGLTSAGFSLTLPQGLGGDANGIGFYNVSPAQAVYYNATALSTGSVAGGSGDVIYFAVDLTNHLFWVSSKVMRTASTPWNNSGSANPATGVGGLSFTGLTCPCFITFNGEEASAATINAGGPFIGTVPTGFVAWQAPITSGNHPIIINIGN